MTEQTHTDNRHNWHPSRNIVQASVALVILTAALWIGWWPDLSAVQQAGGLTEVSAEMPTAETPTTTDRAEDRPDNLQRQEISDQKPLPAAQVILSLAGEAKAESSVAPVMSSGETHQRSTSTPTSAIATTRSTTQAQQPLVKTPETVVAATTTIILSEPDQSFAGISPDITSRWQFPLQIETHTPDQGVFGAGRTSTRLHAGIDLYAPDGTEVFAMTGGKVRQIYLFYESLLAIEVENDDGTTIRYTELTPLVKVGDRVDQGQLIARLKKNSGGTCMLHLEIYATAGTGPLTQVNNKNYLYVPMQKKSYMRRSDLVDPSAVYQLTRP